MYLSYGMSYEQFWYGEPELTTYYRKKYYLDLEKENYLLWLNGLYMQDAFAVVMANSFSKNSKAKYLDKPIDILPKSENELMNERKKEQAKAIDELSRWADRWNKNNKGD